MSLAIEILNRCPYLKQTVGELKPKLLDQKPVHDPDTGDWAEVKGFCSGCTRNILVYAAADMKGILLPGQTYVMVGAPESESQADCLYGVTHFNQKID